MKNIEQAKNLAEQIMARTRHVPVDTNILDLLQQIGAEARIIELLLREFLGHTQKMRKGHETDK